MKKYLIIAAAATMSLAASAQNKLSWSAIERMEAYHQQVKADGEMGDIASPRQAKAKAINNEEVSALVLMQNPADYDNLLLLGFDAEYLGASVALVTLPLDRVDELAALSWVVNIDFGVEATPRMDMARAASNVDPIHAGVTEGLGGRAYTGKGVIVSCYDTGLDPNHVNFLESDGYTPRAKNVVVVSNNGGKQIYDDYNIPGMTTEAASATHGTHVLGIAAGGYRGELDYAGTVQSTTGANPYYGVAYDADLLIGCGSLQTTAIASGVDYLVKRAQELNQPLVVNLSLGSNAGPHDGSDSFGRALNEYGKTAIICVSAGNEGDLPMGLNKLFTDGDTELLTFPAPYVTSTGSIVTSSAWTGQIEIYASDNRPLKVSLCVVNADGEIVSEYTVAESTNGKSTKLPTNATIEKFDSAVKSGTFTISSNVSTTSNRYGVMIKHDAVVYTNGAYNIGLKIEGAAGQRVNLYATASNSSVTGLASTFSSRDYMDWMDGSPDGSINDMACADNVLAIGSYNSRDTWYVLGRSSASTYSKTPGYKINTISGFSSYGTMRDGSTLPHVCAPGSRLISSVNGYYSSYTDKSTGLPAYLEGDDRTYQWDLMQGTSMASPFAAGVFALWLEADPTLTSAEIKDILKTTSIRDSYVTGEDPAKWGAGKLDALEGIKEVIRRRDAGVDGILADAASASLILEPVGQNVYNAFLNGVGNIEVSLYSLSGSKMSSVAATGDQVEVDASALPAGVYLLSASNGAAKASAKIVVK